MVRIVALPVSATRAVAPFGVMTTSDGVWKNAPTPTPSIDAARPYWDPATVRTSPGGGVGRGGGGGGEGGGGQRGRDLNKRNGSRRQMMLSRIHQILATPDHGEPVNVFVCSVVRVCACVWCVCVHELCLCMVCQGACV